MIEIVADDDSSPAYLLRNTSTGEIDTDSQRNLIVACLSETTRPTLGPSLQATLGASGWTITQQTY